MTDWSAPEPRPVFAPPAKLRAVTTMPRLSSPYGYRTDPVHGTERMPTVSISGTAGHAGSGIERRPRRLCGACRQLWPDGRDRPWRRPRHPLRPSVASACPAGRARRPARRHRTDGIDRAFDRQPPSFRSARQRTGDRPRPASWPALGPARGSRGGAGSRTACLRILPAAARLRPTAASKARVRMEPQAGTSGLHATLLNERGRLLRFPRRARGRPMMPRMYCTICGRKSPQAPERPGCRSGFLSLSRRRKSYARYPARDDQPREAAVRLAEGLGDAPEDEPAGERILIAREQLQHVQTALASLGSRVDHVFRRYRLDGVGRPTSRPSSA